MMLGRERGVSRTIPDWSVLDSLWESRSRGLHEMVEEARMGTELA